MRIKFEQFDRDKYNAGQKLSSERTQQKQGLKVDTLAEKLSIGLKPGKKLQGCN